MEILNTVAGFLNSILWSDAMIYFCLITGLFFSIRGRFLQIRLIKPMLKYLVKGEKSSEGISSFQALCSTIAGRVGPSNIAGVATAIFWGGPGALFWMWMLAFLGAASSFAENTLAQLYKIKIGDTYCGGPAYTADRGWGKRWFAVIMAVTYVLAGAVLIPGMSYAVPVQGMTDAFHIPAWTVYVGIAIVLALVIFGGIKRIANFASVVVPFMAGIYIIMALITIALNIELVPGIIRMVFASAFGMDAVFGGIVGSAISWGVKRGVFSSDAGNGTQTGPAAAAEVSHPAKQGLVQAFSIYVDTLFVCTATGIMIMMTDCFNVVGADGESYLHIGEGSKNMAEYAAIYDVGPQYASNAIDTVFMGFGAPFIAICLIFFGVTSVIANYYMAEVNMNYLSTVFDLQEKTRKVWVLIIRLAFLSVIYITALNTVNEVWVLADVGLGLCTWLNLIMLWGMNGIVIKVLKDYDEQYKMGIDPYFNPEKLGIKNADIWMEINKERIVNDQ